ncbi:MAG TPA: hypothetical protein VGV61_08530, partial [Thermoanaerobaculia bacterium]|nr:hypothetical protein [Thermoanaerobaculia bacterium]
MDDWLASFLRWAEKPCPTGAWLYRGQAARHRGIVPTGLRESHRDLCRHPLYDVDYETAAELLRDSPVFGDGSLYPRTIDDPLGRELERFAYGLAGGPPLLDSRLSFAEL